MIASNEEKERHLQTLNVSTRLEADKMDILLLGSKTIEEEPDTLFGVINVKDGFAERRTDDVPMSEALIKAGYVSPLLKMDCKSPRQKPFLIRVS